MSLNDGFWDRLAGKVRPTGILKTIEDPLVAVRAFSAGLWAAVVQTLISAGLWAIFDEPVVAWAGVGLATTFFLAWVWFAASGSVLVPVSVLLLAGTAGNIYVHVLLGGYAYSGAIMLFGITFVAVAALLAGKRMAITAGSVTVVAGVILGFTERALRESRDAPDPAVSTIFFVIVLVGSINVLVPLIVYFMNRLSQERERAESLLLNVLPAEIAAELKETGQTTARHYDSISVLFADTVGFTPWAASMEPELIVEKLNEVFTCFDTLAEAHGVEKIRTIGDSYMVAAGVPSPRADHAEALAAMSLEMLTYSETGPLTFRVGIHSGPVVAGVIGSHKFQYDIWGDTVNTASRMESHGEPGRIQISDTTRQLIKHRFATTPRGSIEIKGKGLLTTWWLDGEKTATL